MPGGIKFLLVTFLIKVPSIANSIRTKTIHIKMNTSDLADIHLSKQTFKNVSSD